jgi:aryl-alcohol dehydrogenase-like predicted oxidoreductase
MNYKTLGRTGLKVSEVGFGAWAIGGNEHGNSYGPTVDEVSIAAVKRALELGCNFFDTADIYGWGHSEEVLGKALEDRREDVIIATKVGGDFYHGAVRMNFSREYIPFALERSLKRLRTEYLDLYQLHNPPLEFLQDPVLYDVLDDLKSEGKIRHYGVSIHRPVEGAVVVESGRADTLQLPFSIFRQEWIDGLFPTLRESNLGVIAREPLANGFLTGKYGEDSSFPPGDIRHDWPRSYLVARVRASRAVADALKHREETLAQLAIKFCLSFSEVSTVIAGAKTPKQVEENMGAAEGDPLSANEGATLTRLYADNFGS